MNQVGNQAIGPLVGTGRVAEVFEYGDRVLKLYNDPQGHAAAFAEAAILAIVASHDLPAPGVHAVGRYAGRWGLVMDRADGEPLARFAQDQPEIVPDAIDEMVRLHLRMHERPEIRLPALKPRLADRIGRATQLAPELKARLVASLAGLPDGDRLCHGDFHPFNIVGLPGHTTVIDWLDATSGHPAADVCRSFVIMMPTVAELAENYLDRYAALSGIPRAEIIAWLPVIAAARLCEAVPGAEPALLRLAGAAA